jgi:hypothetical protein
MPIISSYVGKHKQEDSSTHITQGIKEDLISNQQKKEWQSDSSGTAPA